jgi:hypothetical protein
MRKSRVNVGLLSLFSLAESRVSKPFDMQTQPGHMIEFCPTADEEDAHRRIGMNNLRSLAMKIIG